MAQTYRKSLMSEERLTDYVGRVARGKGTWLPITWEEQQLEMPADGGTGELKWVTVTDDFYVGKMGPGQSGNLIAILANIAMRGFNLQQAFKRKDALIFLELLGEDEMCLLLSIVTGMPYPWVQQNWDLGGWVIDTLATFVEYNYNDFLPLMEKVKGLASKLQINTEQMKVLASGQ